jgi:hypothetical protein
LASDSSTSLLVQTSMTSMEVLCYSGMAVALCAWKIATLPTTMLWLAAPFSRAEVPLL